MQCTKCGKSFLPNNSFCPFCGELNSQMASIKYAPKRSAQEYTPPKAEIHSKNTVFIDPNTAYDRKANEFYQPHNLPHSNRRSNKRRHRSRQRRYKVIKACAYICAFALIFTAVFVYYKSSTKQTVTIKGSWVVTGGNTDRQGYSYRFTNEGRVNVRKSEADPEPQRYFYRIDDKNTLKVNQTSYTWNNNLSDYTAGAGPYWCILEDTLYLSNTVDGGYMILNKVQKKQTKAT